MSTTSSGRSVAHASSTCRRATAPGPSSLLRSRSRPRSAPRPSPVVVVTATTREAEDLAASLGAFLPPERVTVFPSWETLPHERLSPRSDTVGRRLAVLRRIAHPDPDDTAYGPLSVVVAPVRAVLQPLTKGLGELVPVALRPGDERPLPDVVDALVAAAYTRTDLVERRGEFAVRGGILDVFPPTEEHPVRIEFWGDTVEEVRWFKVADQRSLEVAEHGLWAPPCRELLLTDDVRARAKALADQLPGVSEMLAKVAEGIAVEGMESLAPALVEGMESVLDVLPASSIVLLVDPERIRRRAHDLVATSDEFLEASWANAAAGNQVPVDLQSLLGGASYWTLAQVRAHATAHDRSWWTLTPFAADAELVIEDDDVDERLAVRTVDAEAFRGDTERAVAHLRARVADGWRVTVVTEGPGLAKRVEEVLREHEVAVQSLSPAADTVEPGHVGVTTAPLGRGFAHEGERLEVVDRDRPHRPARLGHLHQGHAADAVTPPQPGRPAPAATGRLRRARAARRRPLRRDDAAHRRRRHPRVPRHRVRTEQARPAGRPPLRADRPARPGDQVRRRRGAQPQQDGRLRLDARRSRGPSATSSRSPPTSSGSTAPVRRREGTPSRPTARGSASSRRPSATSRRPTS